MLTACRYHPRYHVAHDAMVKPYQELLASHLIQPMHTLATIHALLILCTWPITVPTQPDDPSWNYCGLATNAALLVGLHKPGQEREYGFPRATTRDIELRSRTMLQIFRLNVLFKCVVGLSPTLADETYIRTVQEISDRTRLDNQTRSQTDISLVLATYTQQLENNRSGDSRDTLTRAGCHELDDLHSINISQWSPPTLLQYLGAKLFLHGWSLRNTHPDRNPAESFNQLPLATKAARRIILHEALGAATQYIETFANMSNAGSPATQPSPVAPQTHLPKHYILILYFSSLVLYHILSTLPNLPAPEIDGVRNRIGQAHSMLRTISANNPRNERMRLAYNIELVGEFLKQGRRLPEDAKIESRLGASLFYDAMLKIAVIKSERGEQARANDLSLKREPENNDGDDSDDDDSNDDDDENDDDNDGNNDDDDNDDDDDSEGDQQRSSAKGKEVQHPPQQPQQQQYQQGGAAAVGLPQQQQFPTNPASNTQMQDWNSNLWGLGYGTEGFDPMDLNVDWSLPDDWQP